MHETADIAAPSGITPPTPTGSGAVDQAGAIWHALAELGVRDAVLAPGSRSAPLVYGLARPELEDRIRAHMRIDERAAAFTALGLSRHDPAHPAVVVTTSGTATAHLHAAVMEAHHSRIPLLVVTADRPAELREVGANQTTRQAGMYRSLVRFEADLPAPTARRATDVELRTAVSTVARALAAATSEHPGPVHLNLSFRDPLVPRVEPPVADAAGVLAAAGAPAADEDDHTTGESREVIVLTRRSRPVPPQPQPVPISSRTVVVAGDGAGPAARVLAEQHVLPLLAEPSSGAHAGTSLVPGYPALLAQVMADRGHPLRPDRAIVLGRPTLSRPVIGALLGADDVDVIVVDPHLDWADAARRARLVVPAAIGEDPGLAAEETNETDTTDTTDAAGASAGTDATDATDTAELAARRAHLAAWSRAAAQISSGLPRSWQQTAALAVWDASGAQDTLVLGSSSLVRDLEQHAGPISARVIANRGLAGIDGTTALAGGIALAQQDSRRGAADPGRVRLLVGDLTALHDLTGLIIGPEETRPDLDVVIVDDGGGRIFSGLEHSAAPPELLRRFFTTPHGTDLAAAAAALGAEARELTTDSLSTALSQPGPGLRVFVVVQEEHSTLSSTL
ncbi:2-succinyl-5-enolpyruvyl-6-hydroxy-3-cyclohexene-1-carboxylic-acid synthase [Brachybacterium alimentarium]|uniref:2-succinyl-5-enolpyruvyl-6-hydroxy-3- cyclohexene-1-carboxylic-acid synthase n=1 Tax=Brachybacterium alimentarium TaxID=47845 RepID=UPI003FD2E9A1